MNGYIEFRDCAGTYVGRMEIDGELYRQWFATDEPERFFKDGGTVVLHNGRECRSRNDVLAVTRGETA